jgi:hypothetical protein
VRDRGTAVESDVEIAKKEVDRLEHVLKSLPDEAFDKECRPEFILSAEVSGSFFPLERAWLYLNPAKNYCLCSCMSRAHRGTLIPSSRLSGVNWASACTMLFTITIVSRYEGYHTKPAYG